MNHALDPRKELDKRAIGHQFCNPALKVGPDGNILKELLCCLFLFLFEELAS
jgi:hypothetical protein